MWIKPINQSRFDKYSGSGPMSDAELAGDDAGLAQPVALKAVSSVKH